MGQTCANLRSITKYPEQNIVSLLIEHAGQAISVSHIAKQLGLSNHNVHFKIRWLAGCGCASTWFITHKGPKTQMVMLTMRGLAQFAPEGWSYNKKSSFPVTETSSKREMQSDKPLKKVANPRNLWTKQTGPIFTSICAILRSRPGLFLGEISGAIKVPTNLAWYYLKRLRTRNQVESNGKPARYFMR